MTMGQGRPPFFESHPSAVDLACEQGRSRHERIQRPTTAGEGKFERPVARVEEVCPEAAPGGRRDGVRTPFAAAAGDAWVAGAALPPPRELAVDRSGS